MAYKNLETAKKQRASILRVLEQELPEDFGIFQVTDYSDDHGSECLGHTIDLSDDVYIEVPLGQSYPAVLTERLETLGQSLFTNAQPRTDCSVFKDVTCSASKLGLRDAISHAKIVLQME